MSRRRLYRTCQEEEYTESNMELKFMVHKEINLVLFAEADADFVDCLFSFMALPFGTIVRLIGSKSQSPPVTIGCFNNLYESVMNLDYEHFCTKSCKDMLLHPRSSLAEDCEKLKINVNDTEHKYFLCAARKCKNKKCSEFVRLYYSTEIGDCGLYKELGSNSVVTKDKVFVNKDSKFIINENLHVVPRTTETAMELVNKINIKDMNLVEERSVEVGLTQLLNLLKWTLLSRTPFTDLFVLKSKFPDRFIPKYLPLQKTHRFEQDQQVMKMKLTARIVKSNKKVLFVEAKHDFINFLFSFLTIPLGQALHILDGESSLGSIDGLYKSIQALDSQYFISENQKNKLLRPKLATHFDCKNQLFPLEANEASLIVNGLKRTIIDPKLQSNSTNEGLGGFVSRRSLFIVSDNLVVTPYSVLNLMSILNRNQISLSDLEERTVSIGIVEGLSILKASLNSTSVLTSSLFHTLNSKEPKHEI